MSRRKGVFNRFTDWLGGGADSAAEDQLNRAIAEFNLDVPEEIRFNPELLQYMGDFTPEQLQTFFQGRTNLENIDMDPVTRTAQLEALSGLQDIVDSDGLTAQDQFRLAQIAQQQGAQERGSREAILANARERGMAGSGLEMLAQLQAQQDAATRANLQGLGVQAQAQDLRQQALRDLGGLGGSIRGQDFGEQERVLSAQDVIDRFNVGNQQQVAQFNVNNTNQAGLRNLDAQQQLNNANVGMQNEAQMFNNQAGQRRFANEMQVRGARANARGGLANNLTGQAQNTRGVVGGIAEAAFGAGQAALTGGASAGANPTMAKNMRGLQSTTMIANKGGLVPGEPTPGDSVPAVLTPGEFVVRKEDVPKFLEAAHKNKDGSVDVAGILDSVTGGKYRYRGRGQ